jgi:hypothetical protein
VRIQRHEVIAALAEANIAATETGASSGEQLAELLTQAQPKPSATE